MFIIFVQKGSGLKSQGLHGQVKFTVEPKRILIFMVHTTQVRNTLTVNERESGAFSHLIRNKSIFNRLAKRISKFPDFSHYLK
jgi:hypothetical protein